MPFIFQVNMDMDTTPTSDDHSNMDASLPMPTLMIEISTPRPAYTSDFCASSQLHEPSKLEEVEFGDS